MRNVIFDLGGVVFDWNPPEIVGRFYDQEDLRALALREIFGHPDWLELDRGTLLDDAAVERFHKRTGRPQSEMAALLQAARDSLHPINDTIDLLRELAARDVPLYCLSNASTKTVDQLQERHDFWHVFRGIVISGAIKMVKPDPEIFHYIADKYQLTPQETVFIDDSAANIESANRLGFHTVLFKDSLQCRRELMEKLRL